MTTSVLAALVVMPLVSLVAIVMVVRLGNKTAVSWRNDFESLSHAQRHQNEQLIITINNLRGRLAETDETVSKLLGRVRETEELLSVALTHMQLQNGDMILANLDPRPIPDRLGNWMRDRRPKRTRPVHREMARWIAEHFSNEELDELLFDLGVEGDIGGSTPAERGREIVQYFFRRGDLDSLVEAVAEARPEFEWSKKG